MRTAMGNSLSESPTHHHHDFHDAHLPKREPKLESHTDSASRISIEEFLSKIDAPLVNLARHIWTKHTTSDYMELTDYHSLLHSLAERSDKLRSLIDLLNTSNLTAGDVNALISWLSFGQGLDDALKRTVFKSVLSLDYPVQSEIVHSRLRANFTDFADDLSKLIHASLTADCAVSATFGVASGFTDLLNWNILWILAVCLSSPYKRPNPTRLGNIAPLELEQLAHLHCLYNSKTHGFSITRIKELAFDYDGPIILLMKADHYLFCLASDRGLKDSFKAYGAENSQLFELLPDFVKLVSGRSSKLSETGSESGIIYSNFTLKTARRGLLIGHQPLASPAVEVDEGFTELRFAGSPPMKLNAVEIWAAGTPDQLSKLTTQKAWELQEVNKEKNRKIKLDEDWRDSADRHLLSMAGVNVRHSEAVECPESEPPPSQR